MNPADCRVAAVDAVVLRAAQLAADDHDVSQDTVLVRVRDEAGREGIGEAGAPAGLVRDLVLAPLEPWLGRRRRRPGPARSRGCA